MIRVLANHKEMETSNFIRITNCVVRGDANHGQNFIQLRIQLCSTPQESHVYSNAYFYKHATAWRSNTTTVSQLINLSLKHLSPKLPISCSTTNSF